MQHIRDGLREYRIARPGVEPFEHELDFRDRHIAAAFLGRFRPRHDHLNALRTVLAEEMRGQVGFHLTDERIIVEVAHRVAFGSLHISYREVSFTGSLTPIGITVAPPPPPPPQQAAPAPAPPSAPSAPETPTFPASTDVPALAQALKSAAEEGAPYCEECEKARLAAAAMEVAPPVKPPPFPPSVDPEAIAAVLKEAAETGESVCEECLKALAEEEAPDYSDIPDDIEATAAVMVAAAERGTPFCEECMKAAAAAADN